jgi:hypothetical protein
MAGKKKVRARARVGLAAAPLNDFYSLKFYFQYETDDKDLSKIIKAWIKESYSKDEYTAIMANPEYHFTSPFHIAACIFWKTSNPDVEYPEPYKHWEKVAREYYTPLIAKGNDIILERQAAVESNSNVIVLNPHQRLQNKISETVMLDLLDLEDKWMDGDNTATLDLYKAFKAHGLSGSAVDPVRVEVCKWLDEYTEAYSGSCEQLEEAYSHLTKPQLKQRIKTCESMLSDLDSIKNSAKAVRKPRVKKPVTADKQIAKLVYCKENTEFKLTSIRPIQVIGSMRLYVFNTKTKELTEYVSQSVNGFGVKGTSLLNVGEESRKTKLRKPSEFLSIVQSKTPRQIDNEWQKLTTKTNKPNARINQDCILVRALVS